MWELATHSRQTEPRAPGQAASTRSAGEPAANVGRSLWHSVKTFTLTPRRIGGHAGAVHGGAAFIFTRCIFVKVFVLFFPLRKAQGWKTRSLYYGRVSSTQSLLLIETQDGQGVCDFVVLCERCGRGINNFMYSRLFFMLYMKILMM